MSYPQQQDTEAQTALVNLIQALVSLLGVLGIAVPPIFQSLAVVQQIAGILLTIIGILWSLYSHYKKTDQLNTTKAQLHVARAKLAASSRGK